MIRQYERQPIDNATVLVFDDNGTESLIVEPYEGFKLRKKNDNTYSTLQIGIPMQFSALLNKYHAVPIDEPDEVVEETEIQPTEADKAATAD
ncbi:MAG: hypothetical protein UHL70_01010 [Acutalibacteraceae bacterium]|nr:hypothetical protein [Acutalibacteraceae bacterium]